jgi:shikimate dehydrogenase
MFDGLGCAEALRRRGVSVTGKRLMLMGLGGAGTAIAAALASERPAVMWLQDLKADRIDAVTQLITSISPDTHVQIGQAPLDELDLLLNATPLGMLDDQRMAITATQLPESLVVFDAVVIPEQTPLLRLAEACGCTVVRGREMMLGQIARIVDFFQAR